MRGIGRKIRRTLYSLSQMRPWKKRPSLALFGSASAASADFLILSHPDITLTQHTLDQVLSFLAQHPDAGVLYCDEAHFFKPDWSPELLRSMNYPGPLCIIRPVLLKMAGGAPQTLDEAGFYDLWLRIAERNLTVAHLPVAAFARPPLTPDQTIASRAALVARAKRLCGETNFEVRDSSIATLRPATFDFYIKPVKSPLISLIIPTKDGLSMLDPCIRSILTRSTHTLLEILILNNNSSQPETFAYFDHIRSGEIPNCRIIDAPIPFNWSRLNNLGAAAAQGDVLIFMNNDMEVIAPDWLEWLAGYALQPKIGVVGAQLLREDESLQHAGVVLGLGGWCDHLFDRQAPSLISTEFVPPALIRNVSAVTGACMAVSADKFHQYGGFDENYLVCGSDIEYCLRLLQAGLRNVYLPPASLYHLESRTRNPNDSDPDRLRFRQLLQPFRWQGDPYYNVNLSLYDNCGKMRNRWE